MLFLCLFACLAMVQSAPQPPWSRDHIVPGYSPEVPRSSFPSGGEFEQPRKSPDHRFYIPYKIHDNFSENAFNVIFDSLNHYEDQTCLSFVEIPVDDNIDHDLSIFFRNQDDIADCFNYHLHKHFSGEDEDEYPTVTVLVSLNEKSCLHDTRRVKQLIFGALGFIHENLRSDRDDYINILWDNIEPGREVQFRKIQENVENWVLPYDYFSISHHYGDYYSKNGQPTLLSKNERQPLPRTTELSLLDLYKINSVYCKARKTPYTSHDNDVRDQFVIGLVPNSLVFDDDVVEDDSSREDLRTNRSPNSFTEAITRVENDAETTESERPNYDLPPYKRYID